MNLLSAQGTTGKPKGACLSQFTLVNNAILISRNNDIDPVHTIHCMPLPFFHTFAFTLGTLAMVVYPCTLVVPYLKHNAQKLVQVIDQHRVTHLSATPTLVIDLLTCVRNRSDKTLHSLQNMFVGGAVMPVEIAHQFLATVPSCTNFRIGYGATELGLSLRMFGYLI